MTKKDKKAFIKYAVAEYRRLGGETLDRFVKLFEAVAFHVYDRNMKKIK